MDYGEPKEGLFYHYEWGMHPCSSCDRARVMRNDGGWSVQYYKDGEAIDRATYSDEEIRDQWLDGNYRVMYAPVVALPVGV